MTLQNVRQRERVGCRTDAHWRDGGRVSSKEMMAECQAKRVDLSPRRCELFFAFSTRSLHLHKETCSSAGCSSFQLIIQYTGSESYAQRMVYTLRTNIWRTSRADFETVVPC